MFNRTNETKVLRDPIHGYIHIQYQVIWDCLNAREFQRLHRIHQLGGVFQVYHTAEHTRFAHCLGVYETCRRMVYEVDSITNALNESEKIQVMCAALLHDLGHGPFSHFFETLQTISHEERTVRLILDENTEVHRALVRENPDLPEKVCGILEHRHPKKMLNQMIASQLDADRMDYLLRDAYETGTSYGTFDLERVLRTLRVKDDVLCMKESGMHSVEDYIMARYHMYWQVYLHPDAKSYEVLIELFFKRYFEVDESIEIFDCLSETLSNEEFIEMDENRMIYGFQQALTLKDPILSTFASAVLDRHLMAWIENPTKEEEQRVKDQMRRRYGSLEYSYVETISQNSEYLPYTEEDSIIWILTKQEQLIPLSECSEIVKALLLMKNKVEKRIYFMKEYMKF